MQKAQPITLSHHLLAYAEMFKRDIGRLQDTYKRTDMMPLGSGALATSTYPIDREFVAKELGFSQITLNSLDSVSDRDYVIETLSSLSRNTLKKGPYCDLWLFGSAFSDPYPCHSMCEDQWFQMHYPAAYPVLGQKSHL